MCSDCLFREITVHVCFRKLGEPQKAENYLLDAMKMYREEGWKYLTDMSRLDLARCQHAIGDQLKYPFECLAK